MALVVETLRIIGVAILILSSGFYLRHLTQLKKQGKFSSFDRSMYIVIQIGFLLIALSVVISALNFK